MQCTKQTAQSNECKINFVHLLLSSTPIIAKHARRLYISPPVPSCRVLTCACFTIAFACSCIQCMRGVCEREIIKCVSLPTEEQTHSPHGSFPRCSAVPAAASLYWTTLTFKYSGKVSVTASAALVGTCACMHTCSYGHIWNDKGPQVRSRSAVRVARLSSGIRVHLQRQ